MRIAVIGSGSAAHLISKILRTAARVEMIYHISANPKLIDEYKYRPVPKENMAEIMTNEPIDFVINVSQTLLMNKQLYDIIDSRGLPCAHVDRVNAGLEADKWLGKKLLLDANLPTPHAELCDYNTLLGKFFHIPRPWVLKYLNAWSAGMQTVIITDENCHLEFLELTRYIPYVSVGDHTKFMIEEHMHGVREYSYHAISNAVNWQYIGTARDYKRWSSDDSSFNTAGMGSYSPVQINPLVHEYADVILRKLRQDNRPYRGIIYLGIMEDCSGKPFILEINCRPGDPEIQAILQTHRSVDNILEMFYQCAHDQYIQPITFNDNCGFSVRVVHKDYRKIVKKSALIPSKLNTITPEPQLWPCPPHIHVSCNSNPLPLHSVITTSGLSIEDARKTVYNFLDNKQLFDYIYRPDIGIEK